MPSHESGAGYLSPVHSIEILFSFIVVLVFLQIDPGSPIMYCTCSDGIRHSKPCNMYHEQKSHKYPDMHHEYNIIKLAEWILKV